jgi:hypothetical protein
MLGPDAAARLEVRRLGGMPILGVGDQGLGCQRPLNLAVDQRHDPLALADVEAALGSAKSFCTSTTISAVDRS